MSVAAVSASSPATAPFRLSETRFDALDGFAADDLLAAYRAVARSAEALVAGIPSLRPGKPPSEALLRLFRTLDGAPAPASDAAARRFFETHFVPHRIEPGAPDEDGGFLTGYYEPVVEGALQRSAGFEAPILARPATFRRLGPGDAEAPYPARAIIEAEALAGRHTAVVWLRDWVEVFFVHVQGSARVALPDGRTMRLVYDGRNGQPYTSIGRILVQTGEIPASDMSLERVKAWLRAKGQAEREPGRALMQRNRSYVFFRAEPAVAGEGPIGGAGVPLTRLRSLAVDRTPWSYGLPFWVEADLPWQGASISRFRRLMVAQDTGSAIVGPARADVFFGSGEEAGRLAGTIRHPARLTVLLPRGETIDAAGPRG